MGEEIFVDANIFLEIFLKNDKSEACKNFLRSAPEREEKLYTSDFIVYSCIIQVYRQLKANESAQQAILFFNNLPSLTVLHPSLEELHEAAEISMKQKLDFDDSLVIACMDMYNLSALASLDKHFDKVKTIKRVGI